jgi:hypothetical protein
MTKYDDIVKSRVNSAVPKHPNGTHIKQNKDSKDYKDLNVSKSNNNNTSKISLNIDEDPFITKIDDDFSSKITSKSKLKDILNCDDELIENADEKAKVLQIKNY